MHSVVDNKLKANNDWKEICAALYLCCILAFRSVVGLSALVEQDTVKKTGQNINDRIHKGRQQLGDAGQSTRKTWPTLPD